MEESVVVWPNAIVTEFAESKATPTPVLAFAAILSLAFTVILQIPLPTPVTSPDPFTVATLALSLTQVKPGKIGRSSASYALANSWIVDEPATGMCKQFGLNGFCGRTVTLLLGPAINTP